MLTKTIMIMIVLSLTIPFVTVIAAEQHGTYDNFIVLYRNIAITSTYNNLTLGALGKLTCEGQTEVQDGYSAGLIMELQKYDKEWITIKTWTGTDTDCIMMYQNWYVEKGTYRLQLTHKAYDSNIKQIESFVKYSKTIFY